MVLLHEGVADRRGWAEVAGLLAPELTVVAYDRRGYGQTPPSTKPFSHLDDLLAVIGHASAGPVSPRRLGGGGLALDAALAAPGRVAGLVVMGTAVSSTPEPELDAATKRLEPLLDEAYAARDTARSTAWRPGCGWTVPPSQKDRVGGAARKLALDMNAVIIANDVPETEGAAGVDAWHRLAEITVPVTVACGGPRCALRGGPLAPLLAGRLPAARHAVLAGMAHQPYLESASAVAQLIRSAVTEG